MSLDSALLNSAVLNVAGARDHLRSALTQPQHIAPLPRVCSQLAELTSQPEVDASQLARLIQSDPVLAGEIMRVANSPALRPRAPIVSLQQAVSWLGVAEVRNIAMAVMLRGEVFVAPGHETESESLWREAWLAGLWAKEIARERRKHVETAYLAALMHRTGAALALKILSQYERQQQNALEAASCRELVVEFEAQCGRVLMAHWRLPPEVQEGASAWRDYERSGHAELACTVHAAHLLATHMLDPLHLDAEAVVESAVFESLGLFPDDRRALLGRCDRVRELAGV